jgi:chemotaxis signal transduction protein
MRGMTNLRGELIAIIDSRGLYEMDESNKADSPKVLIFERDGVKQGLMVDSVDSIMPFSQTDLKPIPKIMFSGKGKLIGQDVKNALIVGSGPEIETVCILDLSSVSARVNL